MKAVGVDEELAEFQRTACYYRSFTGLLFTDGIKYLADRARCYWLIDLVGSLQHGLREVPFQQWRIVVSKGRSAVLEATEGVSDRVLAREHIPHTDFPLMRFSFYCVHNTMMLKSELPSGELLRYEP